MFDKLPSQTLFPFLFSPFYCVQFIANLDPAHPEEGMVTPRLRGPHSAQGCQCNLLPVDKLRINHYLGSIGDYMDNKRRYWKVKS